MKRLSKALSAVLTAGILLAFTLPAYAINFDAEQLYESVFVISTETSVGSGFAVGPNSIVTNAHVIKNASEIEISTYDGKTYPASVYSADENLDLALLVVTSVELKPLTFAAADSMGIGDDVYTIGAPKSMAYTLTKGVISAKERMVGRQSYIQIDAAINAGNSGGPLLNDRGEVLGINTLKISGSEGIGLSIPITAASEYFGGLGLELSDSGNIASELTAPVSQPEQSSPTDDKDFQAGDEKKADGTIILLIILLCLSVLLNIAFIIYYIYSKRKNRDTSVDPSERTDFEIEIEE